ncbi:hypothetical protein GCM10022377_19470 [Zhihengliuella alba]|uniref:Uncharacterized protein n=1 Tax=Zhihengliuella alba TaxID=547018 RepID=A0ABP7DK36_9MICC
MPAPARHLATAAPSTGPSSPARPASTGTASSGTASSGSGRSATRRRGGGARSQSPSQCGLVARRMVAIGVGVVAMGALLAVGALSAVGALLATAL